jgi:hypothetical protein
MRSRCGRDRMVVGFTTTYDKKKNIKTYPEAIYPNQIKLDGKGLWLISAL